MQPHTADGGLGFVSFASALSSGPCEHLHCERSEATQRLCWLSSVVPTLNCLPLVASVQGWRSAPPPSAASALSSRSGRHALPRSDRRGGVDVGPWLSRPDNGVEDDQQLA